MQEVTVSLLTSFYSAGIAASIKTAQFEVLLRDPDRTWNAYDL